MMTEHEAEEALVGDRTRMQRITDAFMERGLSKRGGWNRRQLAALGVAWPLRSGWRKALLGRWVFREQANQFLKLRR